MNKIPIMDGDDEIERLERENARLRALLAPKTINVILNGQHFQWLDNEPCPLCGKPPGEAEKATDQPGTHSHPVDPFAGESLANDLHGMLRPKP